MKSPKDDARGRPWATGISILSLAVSIVAVGLTARTFTLTQRPYVGVVEAKLTRSQDGSPADLGYQFFIKNVGKLPARVSIDQHSSRFTTADGTVVPLAKNPPPDQITSTILMPGEVIQIWASFTEGAVPVKVSDVLSGRTRLEIDVAVSYQASGDRWWPWKHYYRVTHVLQLNGSFQPSRAEAD